MKAPSLTAVRLRRQLTAAGLTTTPTCPRCRTACPPQDFTPAGICRACATTPRVWVGRIVHTPEEAALTAARARHVHEPHPQVSVYPFRTGILIAARVR
jgi:hypothetical protein